MVPWQIWSFWIKRLVHNYGDLPEKFDCSRSRFLSLEVIGTDIDRSAAHDFILVFHIINYQPV